MFILKKRGKRKKQNEKTKKKLDDTFSNDSRAGFCLKNLMTVSITVPINCIGYGEEYDSKLKLIGWIN